jgi:hypothetical protein
MKLTNMPMARISLAATGGSLGVQKQKVPYAEQTRGHSEQQQEKPQRQRGFD